MCNTFIGAAGETDHARGHGRRAAAWYRGVLYPEAVGVGRGR